jgi:RNA polymerase sigma factor (sigma-70 family)
MGHDLSGTSPKYLSVLFDVGVCSGLTDSQLLERFRTHRGEAAELAFAALIERHGAMVLRACRGILRDDHEAMDAFQATFLILVRKRGSLWVRDSLGPWLHRVACRAAGRAKADAVRRRALERRTAANIREETTDGDRDDLAAILHDEVNRLPDRFRMPIVLCDMEGRTCAEAAQLMGCPVGTVASRLSRGRDKLRAKLGGRGVVVGIAALGGVLSSNAAGAAVPPALLSGTARMAVSSAVGGAAGGVIPCGVSALVRATLSAMLVAELKLVIAVLLSAVMIAAGALVVARQLPGYRPRGGSNERAGLASPAIGGGVPVVIQRAVERPREQRDGQEPALNGKIVIFGEGKLDVPDIHQIRVLDPVGGAPRTVAQFAGHAWSGRVSPDGRRIAFLLFRDLWVMDADGRNREMVVEKAGGAVGMGVACWSPDGRKVGFHRQDKGSAIENYVVDLDRRTLARLSLPGNQLFTGWSPDGTEWLAETVGELPNPDPAQFQIYRVKQDGSGRVRVGEADTGNSSARFSPDGRRIAYLTGAPALAEGKRSQIRVVEREGGRSKLILEADPGVSFQSPCWSPDGKRIAVVSMTPGDTAVLIVDAENGGAARRITQPPRNQIKEMSGVTIDW